MFDYTRFYLPHVSQYLDLGFHLFWVRTTRKPYATSAPDTKSHGFKDASHDQATVLAQLEHVLQIYPESPPVLAISTGPSGLYVLDIDTKNGRNGVESYRLLCEHFGKHVSTLTASTPSGGIHFYYRSRAGDVNQRVHIGWELSGLDIRALTSYVGAPPSPLWDSNCIDSRNAYSWWRSGSPQEFPRLEAIPYRPDWLQGVAHCARLKSPEAFFRALSEPAVVVEKPKAQGSPVGRQRHFPWNFGYVYDGEGRYDKTFKYACALRGQGVERDELEELVLEAYHDNCEAGYSDEYLVKHIVIPVSKYLSEEEKRERGQQLYQKSPAVHDFLKKYVPDMTRPNE